MARPGSEGAIITRMEPVMTAKEDKKNSAALPALILFFLAVFLAMVWPFLLSLLIGVMLAMLTRPLYDWLARRGARPKLAASVSIFLMLLLIIVPLALFTFAAAKQGVELTQAMAGPQGGALLRKGIDSIMALRPAALIMENPAALQAQGIEFLQNAGAALSRIILVQAAALPGMVLKAALVFLTWFFALCEGDAFIRWALVRLPIDISLRGKLWSSFRDTTSIIVWATSAAATAQALVILAGFWLLDVPGMFIAAGITFIFAWIPILGSFPVCLAGGVYLYLKGYAGKVILIALVSLIASLLDYTVRPAFLKGRANMHPLLAIVSIFAGIRAFGILGVILGPVVAAILFSMLESWKAEAGSQAG